MTGREILRAIIDGTLPQAPISEPYRFGSPKLATALRSSRGSPAHTC